NRKNKITPRSIQKAIRDGIEDLAAAEIYVQELTGQARDEYELQKYISELEYQMELAARNLQFEKAAQFRDKIKLFRNSAINYAISHRHRKHLYSAGIIP
ncbi:MAG: UvrB/UvrC motif-containing protein, partial [Candidatus Omnitrophica bacterium]|nr:UvrB/UvrC motif-containing protein [Candidatus Omnitrophota bacterium]